MQIPLFLTIDYTPVARIRDVDTIPTFTDGWILEVRSYFTIHIGIMGFFTGCFCLLQVGEVWEVWLWCLFSRFLFLALDDIPRMIYMRRRRGEPYRLAGDEGWSFASLLCFLGLGFCSRSLARDGIDQGCRGRMANGWLVFCLQQTRQQWAGFVFLIEMPYEIPLLYIS